MLIVGIGEYAITNEMSESIVTHALGSCVALIIHSPVTKHTALAHVVLPEADRSEQFKYLQSKPAYFANIIVPKLIDSFIQNKECRKNQLQIQLVGGADSINKCDVFQIGMKNIAMIKSVLRRYSLVPSKMNVGGNISRTVQVNVNDGRVIVKSQNMIL